MPSLQCNFARYPSRLNGTSETAGAVAEQAANLKLEKYRELNCKYLFIPVAVETLSPMNKEGANFLYDLESRIKKITQDRLETSHIFPKNFGSGETGERFIFCRMFLGGGVVVGLTVFVLVCGVLSTVSV